MKFPEQVDMGTLADALKAFGEIVGFDAMDAYFPLHVDSDKITFPGVLTAGTSESLDPNGDYPEYAEASVQVEIKVVS